MLHLAWFVSVEFGLKLVCPVLLQIWKNTTLLYPTQLPTKLFILEGWACPTHPQYHYLPSCPLRESSQPQLSKSPRLQFLVRVYMTPAELMACTNAVSRLAGRKQKLDELEGGIATRRNIRHAIFL